MKRSLLWVFAPVFVCIVALAPQEARANGGPRDRTFGLGLQLGVPLGITGKVFLGEIPAIQFGFGGLMPFSGIGGWVDVVFHFVHIENRREDVLKLSLYAGPGAQVGAASDFYYTVIDPRGPGRAVIVPNGYVSGPVTVAIRAPLGFAIHWQRVAFDTYVEVSPVVFVTPNVFVAGEGAVGARYYF